MEHVSTGAPDGARARPHGRRSTPAARAAAAAADGYGGLPAGVTRWRVAAALRAAARPLGLTATMLALLEHYIDATWDVDWAPGSEPIAAKPVVETAAALDRSERQIRNLETALVEKGLLAWRDSGNHHRTCRRARPTGRMIWGYGPSLAPLAARAEELIALAARARAEAVALRRARIAISALRRAIRADLAAAPAREAAPLERRFAARPSRFPATARLADLEAERAGLKALAAEALALVDGRAGEAEDALSSSETSGAPELRRRHRTETASDSPSRESSGAPSAPERRQTRPDGRDAMNEEKAEAASALISRIALRPGAGAGTGTRAGPGAAPGRARPGGEGGGDSVDLREKAGLRRIALGLALSAAGPGLLAHLEAGAGAGWARFSEAGRATARDLGIGPALWSAASETLGREGAALIALTIERGAARRPGGRVAPISAPGAYFRAMTERARCGRLSLDRSIRALAAEGGEERSVDRSN